MYKAKENISINNQSNLSVETLGGSNARRISAKLFINTDEKLTALDTCAECIEVNNVK